MGRCRPGVLVIANPGGWTRFTRDYRRSRNKSEGVTRSKTRPSKQKKKKRGPGEVEKEKDSRTAGGTA